MIIWEWLNALIDLMNSYGSNDYASITFILLIGAIVYDKIVEPILKVLISIAKEAISDWRVGRALRKSKEAVH